MKANRRIKIKSFKFRNNYNIDYNPYYIIEDRIYHFYDMITSAKFMIKYGIMCQCERNIVDNKVIPHYNNRPITDEQKDFIAKRGQWILEQHGLSGYVGQKCGCKKKR